MNLAEGMIRSQISKTMLIAPLAHPAALILIQLLGTDLSPE